MIRFGSTGFFLLMAASAWANRPPVREHAVQVTENLYRLNGNFLKSGNLGGGSDLPDPSPPFVNARGEVEIYGTADHFLRYANWKEFLTGGVAESVPLSLRDSAGIRITEQGQIPWDLRKYLWRTPGHPDLEILVGGSMSATHGRRLPKWPDDNITRRIFIFRKNNSGDWIRDPAPIVGDASSGWMGHSYGGNFFQLGQLNPDLIDTGLPNPVYFFYERVTENAQAPSKTEIFARKLLPASARELFGPEIKILGVGKPPFPSTHRTIGGYLVEGPRPVEMSIQGKLFFIIGFSSGDFCTDSYRMNYAWSKNVEGPYHPSLDHNQKDLIDFGSDLKSSLGLSWVGRPAIFLGKNGKYEVLFHAVLKSILPNHDYRRWPEPGGYDLGDFFRSTYKSSISTRLNEDGSPDIQLDLGRKLPPLRR